ncbi:MAG: hypothetical protein KGI28_07755 [Thaumarchaeota archaeon]|nr:hypothetical protein [Nitrososphaerota archaeon]
MKILLLSLATLAGIVSILFASSYVVFATAESTSILDSSIPPIILTQVELWGPSSFHIDGIKACEYNETSLGPWAVGWVEIHNTQNDSITINDVDLKGKGWEEGQFPMTIGPQEYCYIVTQNQLSTRIGVGGSLGNGPPPHDNATTTISYSIQSFDKKMNYTDSTPPLSDDIGDTKTWQLVDSNWIFQDADFKQEFSTKIVMLPPLKQFRSGISTNDIVCKEGLYLAIKSNNQEPVCLKAGTISKLASRGFLYGINANETTNTTILIPPGSEDPSSNKTYSPDVATVVLGVNNTVTWVNQAEAANSIAPDMPLQQDGKLFDSNGVIKPGGSYQFTFTEPGTFAYHGEPHPWQKGTIIVLPYSNSTDILAKTYSLKQVHYYDSSNLHPKISLYDYSYDGIGKDGLVSIDNQTFYQTTLDNDIYKLKGVSVQFHNVTFSFPEGTLITPGGAFVNLDVKFQDDSEEIYGGTMSSPDGSSIMVGGISIPTQYGPHVTTNSITVLGNHTMPQAGLTIYHDKIKLLVSADDKMPTENNSQVNKILGIIPSCVSTIPHQYAIAGPPGDPICPYANFAASDKILNATGFYGIYNYSSYPGTLNYVLEPGHNGTIMFLIHMGMIHHNASTVPYFNQINITNDIVFMHDAGMHDHPGVDVLVEPKSQMIRDDGTSVTMRFSVSKDALPGIYWVTLPPGFCVGGQMIILTVADCEK